VLDFALMWKWNVGGLAFATSAAGWYQAIVLFWLLRKELGLLGGREILRSFVFSSIAGVAMGLVCYGLSFHLLAKLHVAFNVLISVAAGSVFYLLLSRAFRVEEYRILMDILRRRKMAAA
jgi:putative peptidoglycan lipid II flippase